MTEDEAKRAINDRLEAMIGRVRLYSAPPDVHARLTRLLRERATRVEPVSVRRRVTAILRSDGVGQGVFAAARGGHARRQMLFTTPDVDVTIQIHPSTAGNVDVDGMVLHADGNDHPGPVRVERDGALVAEVVTGDVGSFRVRGLSNGEYTLIIGVDDVDVVVGPIEVLR